ncbi:MAG: type VI secretion system tip protein VgrG [Methylobacter sp.]|nr:MAG: type VI secretion system tip protein VgrG [Methylobacter sp.]
MPLSAWSQQDRLLRLNTPLGEEVLLAESVNGFEDLQHGYRFDISALATDAHLSLKTLIGQPALLELQTPAGFRPFHGHITQAQAVGANGGLARYRLVLEPWLAFLAFTRDSAVYQDLTVVNILDAIFQSYQGQGTLNPQWRYDLADASVYPRRSLTTQYQETDAAFMQRLLAEDGLFLWFEHHAEAASTGFGSHTLVIADHNGACPANTQPLIRFTQAGAVLPDDSIDRLRLRSAVTIGQTRLQSWDYRSLSTREVQAAGDAPAAKGEYYATLGAYAYTGPSHGERLATVIQQAFSAQARVLDGEGTARSLTPGTTFTLHEHPHPATQAPLLLTRVEHQAHNNLSADLYALVEQNLGLPQWQELDAVHTDHSARQAGQRVFYRNRFTAIPAEVPYRNPCVDALGQLRCRKPSVHGQQTAIVVGPPGDVIHTDRDHRVKVQFHWQRGDSSHSRLPAPRAGHSGAPADHRAGTWVRVLANLAPTAGANWGGHSLPRIGQEVLVDFIDGDVDRPVVIGALYNGQAQPDAQANPVSQGAGAAIGGHSPWFPGHAGGHAHPASLSGLKSQALGASQQGQGAYSQLVFDDSPQQSRLSVQHHAAPHQGTAELNLGSLRQQTDNQRLTPTGFGAELKTENSAAVRAGQGLLLSCDSQTQAQGQQLASPEARAQLQQSLALQTGLTHAARQHQAQLPQENLNQALPAQQHLQHSLDTLAATDGENHVAAYSEPHLQLSAPGGIAASTMQDGIISAGNSTSLTAGHDLNLLSQGNLYHQVKAGISLFTQGNPAAPSNPVQTTGIALHAATGKVSLQSQSDKTTLTASQTLTIASTQAGIRIAAPHHLLMTAQGAGIILEGGNITLTAPGTAAFKASMKVLAGAGRIPIKLPSFPKSQIHIDESNQVLYSQQINAADFLSKWESNVGISYEFWQKNSKNQIAAGNLNGHGISTRVFTDKEEELILILGDSSWEVIIPKEPVAPNEKEDDHDY